MRGLYEIGRGGQMNKRTACLISLYELEYPHCTLVTSFCLFVCFLVVVVVVVQLFFCPLGFCASQVLLIFFRLSYRTQLGDFYALRQKLVSHYIPIFP